jgi:adenosine kinase
MKNILITGSIAYDHIMFFDGEFKDSLLPEDLDHLSVAFSSKSHDVYFGGCAPNIAYTLQLLGEKPYISGVAGNDFDKYRDWLARNKISTECIVVDSENPCAAAYILNDKSQNQITIFSAGAMNNSKICKNLTHCDVTIIDLAVVAPDLPKRMVSTAENLNKFNIPYIFDPGQAISSMSKEYLALIIDGCIGIITNSYEASLLEEKLVMNVSQIANWAGFYIKTLGDEGCCYYKDGKNPIISAVKGLQVADVTGCGDAFRAGFVHAYVNGKDIENCCKFANVAASFVIDKMGTQTHFFMYDEFEKRLRMFY